MFSKTNIETNIETGIPKSAADVALFLARSLSLAPSALATNADVAIDMPMTIEVEKNSIVPA